MRLELQETKSIQMTLFFDLDQTQQEDVEFMLGQNHESHHFMIM